MKNLFFLLIAIVAISCSDDTERSIAPELNTYVDTFYKAAASRGVSLPDGLVAELKAQNSWTSTDKNGDQYYLRVNPNLLNQNESIIEGNIYYALATGIRLKTKTDEGYTYFKHSITSGEFSPDNREALFDEIFKTYWK